MALWALILLHYWRAVGEGTARLLGRARGRDRPAAAHDLCRAAPGRPAARCSRPPTSARARRCARPIRGSRASSPSSCCSRICSGWRRPATGSMPMLMRLRTPESVIDNFNRLAAPDRVHPCRPCRARRPGRARGRLAVDAARAGAGDRARAGRAVRAAVRLFLRARAGARGDHRRRAGRTGRRRSAASRRWSCCPGSRSSLLAGDGIELSHQRIVIIAPGSGCCWCRRCIAVLARARAAVVRRRSQRQHSRPARWRASSPRASSAAPARRCAIVAGDPRTAALVALAAPSRPSLYSRRDAGALALGDDRRRARKGRDRGLADHRHRRHAAAATSRRASPIWCRKCRAAFERPVQGRLPLLRIGWAVIRPQAAADADAAGRPARTKSTRSVSDSPRPRAPCRGTSSRRTRHSRG